MTKIIKTFLKKILPGELLHFLKMVYRGLKKIPLYILFQRDWLIFKKLVNHDLRFNLSRWYNFPQLNDRTENTSFDCHYIYHPAWAARVLTRTKPPRHVDISSTLNFCAIVSAFIPVDFYDYRPANLNLSNLNSERADLMKLPFEDNSVISLSCMHTIEHIGLGRYGDNIDPLGDKKACVELKRVLAVGGSLLFVVPVGKPRIMFNAHRIYSYQMVLEMLTGLTLTEFSLVDDDGKFIVNASKELVDEQSYGCGCFWLKKYE